MSVNNSGALQLVPSVAPSFSHLRTNLATYNAWSDVHHTEHGGKESMCGVPHASFGAFGCVYYTSVEVVLGHRKSRM